MLHPLRNSIAPAALLGLLFAPAVLFAPLVGQSHPLTFSATTTVVSLPVTVTDSRGGFAAGLTAADFHVYEDGRPQPITAFDADDSPVTVGLLVDHSRSMGPNLAGVAAAAAAFANSSNPQDEMFVLDFNEKVFPPAAGEPLFTHDPQVLRDAILAIPARGTTALFDALVAGLDRLNQGHAARKALILVSDGGDDDSRHTYAQVRQQALAESAAIYSIGLLSETEADQNPDLLRKLARLTGAVALFPDEKLSVEQASNQIAHDLRAQYTLVYKPLPAPTSTYRTIAVTVAAHGHGSLRARTRPGYYGPVTPRS